MATVLIAPPHAAPAADPPAIPLAAPDPQPNRLRLELRRPGASGGLVDGGWWPYSLDLATQLPDLLQAVETAGYEPVFRVSYAAGAWNPPPPRKARMLGRIVKSGGFRTQDAALIRLTDGSGRNRLDIVVVAPGTENAIAHRALSMAHAAGDQRQAREILDVAEQVPPPDRARADHSSQPVA